MGACTLKEGTRPRDCWLFMLNWAEHEFLNMFMLVLSSFHDIFLLLSLYFHFQFDDQADAAQAQHSFFVIFTVVLCLMPNHV